MTDTDHALQEAVAAAFPILHGGEEFREEPSLRAQLEGPVREALVAAGVADLIAARDRVRERGGGVREECEAFDRALKEVTWRALWALLAAIAAGVIVWLPTGNVVTAVIAGAGGGIVSFFAPRARDPRAEPAKEAKILPGFEVVARSGPAAAISPFELRYDGRFVALANSPEEAFREARKGSANLRKVEAFNRAHAKTGEP